MAGSKLARRNSAPAVRKAPSPKLVKLQARLANISKRTAAEAKSHEDVVFTVGGPLAVSYFESKGQTLPTLMGFEPMFWLGALAYLGGKKALGGKNGKRVEAAGEGMLAVAASRAVLRGSMRVAGEDDEHE